MIQQPYKTILLDSLRGVFEEDLRKELNITLLKYKDHSEGICIMYCELKAGHLSSHYKKLYPDYKSDLDEEIENSLDKLKNENADFSIDDVSLKEDEFKQLIDEATAKVLAEYIDVKNDTLLILPESLSNFQICDTCGKEYDMSLYLSCPLCEYHMNKATKKEPVITPKADTIPIQDLLVYIFYAIIISLIIWGFSKNEIIQECIGASIIVITSFFIYFRKSSK